MHIQSSADREHLVLDTCLLLCSVNTTINSKFSDSLNWEGQYRDLLYGKLKRPFKIIQSKIY